MKKYLILNILLLSVIAVFGQKSNTGNETLKKDTVAIAFDQIQIDNINGKYVVTIYDSTKVFSKKTSTDKQSVQRYIDGSQKLFLIYTESRNKFGETKKIISKLYVK